MELFSSPAAQVIVAIIPIVGIVFGGTLIFFFLLWNHRQTMLQIRNGIYKPANFNLQIFSLLAGMLLTCVGIVLTVLFLCLDRLSLSLLGGLIPLSIGLGFLLFHHYYKP